MEVELHTFGPIRETVGEKVLRVPVSAGATVGDVLEAVESEFPSLDGRFVEDGRLTEDLTLTLNGKAVQHLNGLDTAVSDGDVLRATPPIVGGSGSPSISQPWRPSG